MIKINIEGYELEFEKEYVERYEEAVGDSFKDSAQMYLLADFEEMSIDEIFCNHTREEIMEVIMKATIDEMRFFSGELFKNKK